MASLPPSIDSENFSNKYHLRVELTHSYSLAVTGDLNSPSVCILMDIVPLIISVPPFELPAGFVPTDLIEFPALEFEN